ncbi:MAG TPA: pitrilysin family protein [Gemmatimonadales bacterium]|nr:pitrilysin family protein [Gemmatimonadales bacterium]
MMSARPAAGLRRLGAVLLGAPLALLAPISAQSQAPPLHVPYTADTLANGLVLLVHEDHSVPIVAVSTLRRVGSADERPGRTGFAHLYEHLMFTGSEHAPYPAFDRLLEAAGADNNAYTTEDRTVFYESGPSNALPLMLWLEADRTGWFLPTLDFTKLDVQRDVVKNERRQSYENQPYGLANETLLRMLYPPGHPYSWPVIGSMVDLDAATLGDVKDFFRRYYAPNNTTIAVAGDVATAEVDRLVAHYFGPIPRGDSVARPTVAPFSLAHDTSAVLEDRVQLPRLYYFWHAVPRNDPDQAPLEVLAYVLAGAKNSALTEPLVYMRQLASDVSAAPDLKHLDGDFTVSVTARPGHALPELQAVIDPLLAQLAAEGPAPHDLQQAKNALESQFLDVLERVSSKADLLNNSLFFTGEPDVVQRRIDQLRAVTADDVKRVARQYLGAPKAVLSVVPEGKRELAAKDGGAR